MIKRLLFLFLLLSSFALRAQTVSPGDEGCIWKSVWTPAGTGTEWVHGVTDVDGVKVGWWTWWCPRPDGTWRHMLQRCVVGRACLDVGTLTGILDTAARSAEPLQALRDARAQFATPVLPHEQEAWERAGLDAAGAAARILPQVAYVVGPATAADGTRPAYPFTNGARGTTVIGRATSGQPCDPTKGSAAASSGGIWAVFGPSFDPARVALCVKR